MDPIVADRPQGQEPVLLPVAAVDRKQEPLLVAAVDSDQFVAVVVDMQHRLRLADLQLEQVLLVVDRHKLLFQELEQLEPVAVPELVAEHTSRFAAADQVAADQFAAVELVAAHTEVAVVAVAWHRPAVAVLESSHTEEYH